MKKKTLQGMTLMEIVVSMAVYGVLALLLVEIMSCVNATMRATTQLNARLSYEAKYADNRLTVDDYVVVEDDGTLSNPMEHQDYRVAVNFGVQYAADNVTISDHGTTISGENVDQYTARYESTSDFEDYSVNVNYKYLVYTPRDEERAQDLFTTNNTFIVNLDFSEGGVRELFKRAGVSDYYLNYPLTKIEVIGKNGTRLTDPSNKLTLTAGNGTHILSATVNRLYPYAIMRGYKTAAGSLDITGSMTDYNAHPDHFHCVICDKDFTVPSRNPNDAKCPDCDRQWGDFNASVRNMGELEIILYADMTKDTGNKTVDITDGEGVKHPSNDYPFIKLDTTFCMWIADSQGEIYRSSFYTGTTFRLNKNGSVSEPERSIPLG